jgi:uncharacterized protein YqjF (DUF2071 family)
VLKPFLTANWRYLAMLNFAIDPQLLAPHVPVGTELDFFNGETYISVVGFLFLNTMLLGLPIPRHRDFEEVNLRFYVRKKSADTWRRGVVFVREFVPRPAIAVTARVFYGEPYLALPMKSAIEHVDLNLKVEYSWRRGAKWETLAMNASGDPEIVRAASHEEFITEHYWGYTARGSRTSEYRVEHPRWKIWKATAFNLRADLQTLYGEKFVAPLSAPPVSAFIADGSFVSVYRRAIEEI